MWRNRVRELVASMADGVMATADQVRGLDATELSWIEHDQPAPLTGAYRLFLELAGRGAGHFLRGSDVFFPAVMGLGQAARELLEENEASFTLLDSDRVFRMQQGYQFLFLRGGGPDPAVWSYCETAVPGAGVPVQVHDSFTDWLELEIQQLAREMGSRGAPVRSREAQEPGRARCVLQPDPAGRERG